VQTTLILNICALIVASIVAVEGSCILQERSGVFGGIFRPLAYWGYFVPAFVMLIVRNRTMSLWFLFFYIVLAIEMYFKALAISSGTYKYAGHESPLGHIGLLIFFSLFCLAIYVVAGLKRIVTRKIASGWIGRHRAR